MEENKELIFMLEDPYKASEVERKSLQQRLDEMNISKNDIVSLKDSVVNIGESALDILGGPVGKTILTVMDWNKDWNEKLEKAKQAKLLGEYIALVDDHEKAIEMLIDSMTNPYGNIIINKIFTILKDFPADGDMMHHLSSVLTNVCNNKQFEELFSHNKFCLSLINRLSPQALTIIEDTKNWAPFRLSLIQSVSGKISTGFEEEFANAYASKKSITDKEKIDRIKFTVEELNKEGHIVATQTSDGSVICVLTQLGQELNEFISIK